MSALGDDNQSLHYATKLKKKASIFLFPTFAK